MMKKLKLIGVGIIIMVFLSLVWSVYSYKNKLEVSEHNLQVQETVNKELNNNIDTIKQTSSLTIKQLEQLRKNEQKSIQYINNKNKEIDNLIIDKTDPSFIIRINKYEECMALNYNNPRVVCSFGE